MSGTGLCVVIKVCVFFPYHLEFLCFDFIPQVHYEVGQIQIGFIYFHLGKALLKTKMLTVCHHTEHLLCVASVADNCNLSPRGCWSTLLLFMSNVVLFS